MSRRGFYTMARGYFDHSFFAPEPFTEREAFQWMIETAAYEPCTVRVDRTSIALERGQLAFALRFLATKWKWSEPRVRRFLKRLTRDAMVLVQPTRIATQITICNYDKHQTGRRTNDAQTDAPKDTEPTHSRRKEERNKRTKELKKELPAGADDIDPPEDRFWSLVPKFSEAGIIRSRLGQLAKACNGDFVAAIKLADAVLRARQPNSYLTAVLKSIEVPEIGSIDPDIPGFVTAAQKDGLSVAKHPNGWKINGTIYDQRGIEIGW